MATTKRSLYDCHVWHHYDDCRKRSRYDSHVVSRFWHLHLVRSTLKRELNELYARQWQQLMAMPLECQERQAAFFLRGRSEVIPWKELSEVNPCKFED